MNTPPVHYCPDCDLYPCGCDYGYDPQEGFKRGTVPPPPPKSTGGKKPSNS